MATVIINQFIEKFANEDGVLTDIPKEELEEIIQKVMGMGKAKKAKKEKKQKDPNAPKKALSAYFIFLAEKREEITASLVDGDEELSGRKRVTKTTKIAGEMWGKLSDDEKEPYKQKSTEDKQRYLEEMESYEPSGEDFYKLGDYPEAPEGWDGPYRMKYLYKLAKGEDGKSTKQIKSFEEAVTVAETLDNCGGITKTSRGYSLRVGPELKETPENHSSGGMASWVKKTDNEEVEDPDADEVEVEVEVEEPDADEVEVEVEVEEPKTDEVEVEVEEPKTDEVEVEVEEPDAEEVEVEVEKPKTKTKTKTKKAEKTEKTEKKKRGRPRKAKKPEPEPEPEPSDDDSDEEENEEVDAVVVSYEGSEYYWDKNTDKIYDPETSDIVGILSELGWDIEEVEEE